MKRFFEEHTSVVIICIVISLLLCIIGCINNINDDGTVTGKGLLKIVGDNLTDTIDTYQKQVMSNENFLTDTFNEISSTQYCCTFKNVKNEYTLIPGKTYTLSFEGSLGNSGATDWYANILFYDKNDVYTYPVFFSQDSFKKKNGRWYATAICPNYYLESKSVKVGIYGYPFVINRPAPINVKKIKLEEGSKVTPYAE